MQFKILKDIFKFPSNIRPIFISVRGVSILIFLYCGLYFKTFFLIPTNPACELHDIFKKGKYVTFLFNTVEDLKS